MPFFGSQATDSGLLPQTPAPTPSIFNTPSKAVPATVIAKGVRLEGQFKSQGDVLIEGEVQGTVQTESLLTVGPEAWVKAKVMATDAVVAGKIEGDLTCKRRLEVKSTAKIFGDIACETITVEAGATLKGQLASGTKPETKAENASDPSDRKATPSEPEKTDAANKT